MTATTFDASARSTVWLYAGLFALPGVAFLGIGWKDDWSRTAIAAASTPCFALALAFSTLRVRFTVDRGARRLSKSIRVLGMRFDSEIPWRGFRGLALYHRSLRTGTGTLTRDHHYPVVLVREDGPLDLYVGQRPAEARRMARRLSTLFELPCEDRLPDDE